MSVTLPRLWPRPYVLSISICFFAIFFPRSSSSLFSLLSHPVSRLHHTSRRRSYPDLRLSNLTHRLGLCLLAASSWLGLNTAILLFPFLSCNSAFTIPGWNLHAQFTGILAFSQSPFWTLAYTIIAHHLIRLLELFLSLSSSIASFPPDMLCLHFAHSRSPSTLK